MAAITLRYLFDAERFRECVAPLADKIDAGDKDLLAEAAAEAVRTSLGIRLVSNVYTFSPSDLESEHTEFPDERERLRFWLKVTLSMFLRPISGLGRHVSEPSLRGIDFVDKLKAAGWSAEDVQRLVIGNDLALLLKLKGASSIPQQAQSTEAGAKKIEPAQSPRLAGWLSQEEVTELLGKIRAAQAVLKPGTLDPALSALYGYLEVALARAYISRMGLFTVVTI